VDPDSNLMRAMKVGAWGLRNGRILCIFPEGSRSYDGSLLEFKKGAAILAREVGAPIVPVALRGLYEVWPRDSKRIRLHRVKLVFGAPLPPEADGDYDRDTQRLASDVRTLFERLAG
jgi:1-acyl-sn-glycerol-3-phosphate acyltransferase